MSKKGFAPIIIVSIIALFMIIGIGGYFSIENKQPNKEVTTTTTEAITIPITTTTTKEVIKIPTTTTTTTIPPTTTTTSTTTTTKPSDNLSDEINKYLESVVRIKCSGDGSGFLFKFNKSPYYTVITNAHVVAQQMLSPSGKEFCSVTLDSATRSPVTGIYGQKGIYEISSLECKSWNDFTDVAVCPLHPDCYISGMGEEFHSVPIEELNYLLSSLPNCSEEMPIGSLVFIIGYPLSTTEIKTVGPNGILIHQNRTVTEGIISAYTNEFDTPYVNYFVSAKIDSGNSGGVALSRNEKGLCLLGISTWLNKGQYENMGIIQNMHNVLFTSSSS